jgi:hypothetical protein
MTVTRLDPTIPVLYGRDVAGEWVVAKGRAMLLIDYSEDGHLLWAIADDATGQIWTIANPAVRVRGNDSLGTRCEAPERWPVSALPAIPNR